MSEGEIVGVVFGGIASVFILWLLWLMTENIRYNISRWWNHSDKYDELLKDMREYANNAVRDRQEYYLNDKEGYHCATLTHNELLEVIIKELGIEIKTRDSKFIVTKKKKKRQG